MAEPASDILIDNIKGYIAGRLIAPQLANYFDALISRIRKEQEDKAVMARALEPFSVLAGVLFSRNFNAPDVIMGMTTDDGGDVVLNAGDFFAVRRAITGSSTIISDMEAEVTRLRAALEIIEASENLLGPELRAIARAAIKGASSG